MLWWNCVHSCWVSWGITSHSSWQCQVEKWSYSAYPKWIKRGKLWKMSSFCCFWIEHWASWTILNFLKAFSQNRPGCPSLWLWVDMSDNCWAKRQHSSNTLLNIVSSFCQPRFWASSIRRTSGLNCLILIFLCRIVWINDWGVTQVSTTRYLFKNWRMCHSSSI